MRDFSHQYRTTFWHPLSHSFVPIYWELCIFSLLYYIRSMKKLTIIIIALFIGQTSFAQFGGFGGIAITAISGKQRANVKKHLFVNLNTTIPLSLSQSLSGSKLILPPTYLSAEYGVYQNITLGVMLGTMTTESSSTMERLAQDILAGDIDTKNLNILNLAQTLLYGGTPESRSQYTVRNRSTMIGANIKYNFVGGKKAIYFFGNRTGIKIRNVKENYGTTGNELVDQVVDVAESSSGFFSSFSVGGTFFLDKKNKFAISPEIGWGPGWGDGFSITGNPILFTIGATYHRRPKNPVNVQN